MVTQFEHPSVSSAGMEIEGLLLPETAQHILNADGSVWCETYFFEDFGGIDNDDPGINSVVVYPGGGVEHSIVPPPLPDPLPLTQEYLLELAHFAHMNHKHLEVGLRGAYMLIRDLRKQLKG